MSAADKISTPGGMAFPMPAGTLEVIIEAIREEVSDEAKAKEIIDMVMASTAGMTLCDFFAINAPTEVPEWFSIVDALEPPPLVEVPDIRTALSVSPGYNSLSDELKEHAFNCMFMGEDPTDEVKETVSFAEDVRNAAMKAKKESRELAAKIVTENQARTYFAWRWHYAKQMIHARGA